MYNERVRHIRKFIAPAFAVLLAACTPASSEKTDTENAYIPACKYGVTPPENTATIIQAAKKQAGKDVDFTVFGLCQPEDLTLADGVLLEQEDAKAAKVVEEVLKHRGWKAPKDPLENSGT